MSIFQKFLVSQKKEGHFKVGSPEKLWPLPSWVFHLINKSSTATRLHVGPWHSSVAPKNGWMRPPVEIGGKIHANLDGFFPGFAIYVQCIATVFMMIGGLFFFSFFRSWDTSVFGRFQTGYLPF